MRILVIEDKGYIVDEVQSACQELKVEVIPFEPVSDTWADIYEQLKVMCQTETFLFVLLDHELWNGLTGNYLIGILTAAGQKVVAFSNYENNEHFLKSGAINSIDKNALFGSSGFDSGLLVKELSEIIAKLARPEDPVSPPASA